MNRKLFLSHVNQYKKMFSEALGHLYVKRFDRPKWAWSLKNMNFDNAHLPTKFLNSIFFPKFFSCSIKRPLYLTLLFPHWFIANGKRWSIIRSIDQNKFYKNRNGNQLIQQPAATTTTTKNTEIPKAEFMLSLRNEISLQRYHLGFYCWFCIFMCGIECSYRCGCVLVRVHWYQF